MLRLFVVSTPIPLSHNFEAKDGYEEKRRIREAFNRMGGNLYEALYRWEQEEKYASFLPHLGSLEGLALDDGCGTGLLLERLGLAVGLDFSASLLSTARRKRLRGRHLVLGDAENLPFRDGVYHYIFAVTLINNTPNPLRALGEMARVSRSGGRLIITALKKAFTREGFMKILRSSGLRGLTTLRDVDSRDWVAVAASEGDRRKL